MLDADADDFIERKWLKSNILTTLDDRTLKFLTSHTGTEINLIQHSFFYFYLKTIF